MARVTIDRGALVTYYEPYNLPGAEIPLRRQVYDERGNPMGPKDNYRGPGEVLYAPDGQRQELRIGADNATRFAWYTVDPNPTAESEEYDRGYRAGWKRAGGPTENTIGTVTTTRGGPLTARDVDGTVDYNDGVRDGHAAAKAAKKGPKKNPRRPMRARNPRPDAAAKAYRLAVIASRKASDRRFNLPAGSSRAAVTTANARWKSAAEERDRLGRELSDDVRRAVDAELAAIPNPRRNPRPRASRLIPSSEREAEQWFAEADQLDASAAKIEAQAAAIDVARGKYEASPFYQQATAQRERAGALRAAVRKYAAAHGLPKCKPVKKAAPCPPSPPCPRCGYPAADTRAASPAPAAPRPPEVWLPVKGTQRDLFARKNPRTCRCATKDRTMKRTREHPIAAAHRLGEQFHRWQGAGLRKAVRMVMRRNPAPRFKVGDTVRDTFHDWTTKVLRVDDHGTFTLYLCEVPAAHWTSSVTRVSSRPGMLDGYMADSMHLRAVAKNPAGWQHTEASAAVRRATQTGNAADRQAAASALARLASKRRPSQIPNPQNPADPIASKVAALRRAIRKAVASQEADGDRSVYLPVYRMLDKIEDFAWRNSMPFDGSPLRAEITVAIGEGQARRRAYLDVEGDRIDAARRAALNTPEARYLAELRQGYGR